MGKRIKVFNDGSILEYDKGSFDDWCVYLERPGASKYAPKDFQYFQRLHELGTKYGSKNIYNDFVKIYNLTTSKIETDVLDEITKITAKYGEHSILLDIDFTIIYAGMVAEENKAFTKLGKRIKRLGIYQVLIDGMPPNDAANFSRGKKWYDIDKICQSKDF